MKLSDLRNQIKAYISKMQSMRPSSLGSEDKTLLSLLLDVEKYIGVMFDLDQAYDGVD